jgi:hypothetical protein
LARTGWHVREVIPNLLWIGHAGDARAPAGLLDRGIAAVIDLAIEEPLAACPREMVYCRFPLLDGSGNPPALLRAAVRTTERLLRSKLPTLVACGGGLSRSPAIAAAALALVHGIPPATALAQLAASGLHDVSPGLWDELCQALSSE